MQLYGTRPAAQVADLAPSEFIAVMLLGLCVLALGVAMRVFQYQGAAGIREQQVQAAGRLADENLIAGRATAHSTKLPSADQ